MLMTFLSPRMLRMSQASGPCQEVFRASRDNCPLTRRRSLQHTQFMKGDGSPVISSKGARYAAFALAALVLAEIAATPFAGAGLDRLAGVHGTYVPVGDLIVDGCIVAIALVVIW